MTRRQRSAVAWAVGVHWTAAAACFIAAAAVASSSDGTTSSAWVDGLVGIGVALATTNAAMFAVYAHRLARPSPLWPHGR